MCKPIFLLSTLAMTAFLMTGCAGPENKLGRGIRNIAEPVRMGELRRSVEQSTLMRGPDVGQSTGVIRGVTRTAARTGVGLYEIVTFPFPPYRPVMTDYLAPDPVYPDSYQPGMPAEPTFDTDTHVGISGGDVAPMIPGSRFHLFP